MFYNLYDKPLKFQPWAWFEFDSSLIPSLSRVEFEIDLSFNEFELEFRKLLLSSSSSSSLCILLNRQPNRTHKGCVGLDCVIHINWLIELRFSKPS